MLWCRELRTKVVLMSEQSDRLHRNLFHLVRFVVAVVALVVHFVIVMAVRVVGLLALHLDAPFPSKGDPSDHRLYRRPPRAKGRKLPRADL